MRICGGGGGNSPKNSNLSSNLSELHCFEPSFYTFQTLSKHINQAYPNLNIKLNNLALSHEQSKATLYYNEKGSGLASLSKRRLDHYGIDFSQSEEVATSTLDVYCEEHKISHIHLLKMDVEGHEIDVLNGGKALFERGGVDVATFEFGGCFLDARKSFFQDFWYFFKDYDMQIFRILKSAKLYKIPFYKEFYEQAATTNYVVIKRKIAEKIC